MTAEDTIDLANSYAICDGNPLSPSQELRLRNGMAQRSDGSWAASRVGDFGGRQGAGKTDTIIARILGGILLVEERLIIYTAHEYPTANEIFIRLKGLFDAWDDLGRLLSRPPKQAHGDQGFELEGGRRILIKTRTGKSGRGFSKADLLVYDEAQHLRPEHVAGSVPAKLANPNAQSWYAGSGGFSTSVKAWEMRRQALLGTGGRLSYAEHTAEAIEVTADGRIVSTPPDPEDRDAWAMANPGLGRWVTEESMADMLAELNEQFSREGLCVWEPEQSDGPSVIDFDAWASLAQVSAIDTDRRWALAVSHDRKWAALGLAGRRSDGLLHVEWMEHRSGTGWIVERVVEGWEAKSIPIRIHRDGAEGSLIDELVRRGVKVDEVTSAEVARSTGALIDAVNNRTVRHLGQPSLDKAVRVAQLTTTAKGASMWDDRSGDLTTLKAVTVALGGVNESVTAATEPLFAYR